jgi:Mg2+ and Co2+ transporter CorA
MRISIWESEGLREATLKELGESLKKKTWFDVTDPSVEDMERLADALKVPRHTLIGKLKSNYPHVDSYPEYTKVFTWYLNTKGSGKDLSFDMAPMIVFTNGSIVITIGRSWTQISEVVAAEFTSPRIASASVASRVAYLTLSHALESYEHFVEKFEGETERFEDEAPPWPKGFYSEAFIIRREASSLLRLLRHFRMLAEALTDGRAEVGISEADRKLFDGILERATGAEETTETTQEIMRDLISMHMDTLSHDMNRAMRLIAALTVIVGIPSLIGSILGANTVDSPYSLLLWQVVLISVVAAGLLALLFYMKGWLGVER